MSDADKLKTESILQGVYYNKSCSESLANRKDEAINSFEKAIKVGYTNYSHASKDSDLDNIREYPKFKELMLSIREKGDYTYILQNAGEYFPNPIFTYQSENSTELVKLKEYFNLDSIAGSGDEISKIFNLMTWTHSLIRHDGSFMPPVDRNAISLYEYAKKYDKGINCRALAIFLNECYLALGLKSRYVTCMPKNENDPDCHVINSVFSKTLNKWIWVDPTFNTYVKDEHGNLLAIAEVRERIIKGLPVTISDDANWNNSQKQTKEGYIDAYMAKNLYRFQCSTESKHNVDSESIYNKYVSLLPSGFTPKNRDSLTHYTLDDNYFWENEN